MFASIDVVLEALSGQSYIADRSLATALFLALRLEKPLLLEGEAGVGKTEVAKALAGMLGARLIRIQGYEGIDMSAAVYEWNYTRQIMAIRLAESSGTAGAIDVYSDEFLIKRPVLQAMERQPGHPAVLLIDELDRADDEFEAFLLEVLSEFQVSIPEIGTIRAEQRPVVIITSNRTRELHEALKRRCLYHWIDYPTFEKELAIVTLKAPEAGTELQRSCVALVQELRRADLYKAPGISETLDWIRALSMLGQTRLSPQVTSDTFGVLLKNHEDIDAFGQDDITRLVDRPRGSCERGCGENGVRVRLDPSCPGVADHTRQIHRLPSRARTAGRHQWQEARFTAHATLASCAGT